MRSLTYKATRRGRERGTVCQHKYARAYIQTLGSLIYIRGRGVHQLSHYLTSGDSSIRRAVLSGTLQHLKRCSDKYISKILVSI